MQLRALRSLALAGALAACHRWGPLTPETKVGASVHLDVTEDGTTALTAVAGPRVQAVVGDLVRQTADTLYVAVREVNTRDADTFFLQGTHLAIATEHLRRVQVRTLDRRRTAIAVLAAVVGAVTMVEALEAAGFGSGDPPGGGGGTPAIRIP